MITFGPVSSRRLGFSLGINNIQRHKSCTYNCVYCQLGRTNIVTINPENQYDIGTLIGTVHNHLKKLDDNNHPDYLTFVAQGEPTLDSRLGEEISHLKDRGIPVAVITNASLLSKEEIRRQISLADWISVKIDTVDENIWKQINRPHKDLQFKDILGGIRKLSEIYGGKLCTETMLVRGFNDGSRHLEALAAFIKKLNPSLAYLAVPTRPPNERTIQACPGSKLSEAWGIFTSHLINAELLTGFEEAKTGSTGNAINDILNITAVHPLRQNLLDEILEKSGNDMTVVNSLIHQRLLKKTSYRGKTFYIRYYPGIN